MRPTREPASPSALAPALLRWAAARGLDVALVAARGGLEVADAERDDAAITARAMASMLDALADLAGDPQIGLQLPASLTFRRYDAGALAARVAPTPRAALEAVAKYAPLVFPRLEARVECTVSEVAIHASFAAAPRGFGHHVDEYLLALVLHHCRRGNVAIHPLRVWLTSPRPPGDLPTLGTTEVEFGAESTGLALRRGDAEQTFPSFDPMLVAVADQIASAALAHAPRPNALAATVATKIESLLPGDVSADAIAAALKMSARTLQRRLEDEGIRFSTVLDETRASTAKKFLADPKLALAEVAYKIGFSDLATFSRAFKRWTGVPPGTFRRRTAPRSPAS
jgi:AraC-like DNA-binding protein